jgi:hypothetical protein
MAVCRKCHEKYGDKKEFKEFLKDIHLQWLSSEKNKCLGIRS